MTANRLPLELWEYITTWLPLQEYHRVRSVNRLCHGMKPIPVVGFQKFKLEIESYDDIQQVIQQYN
jgi:hypothetical protein